MKREIKFRAYDTKENKWLYGYDMPNLGGFSLVGETVLLGEFGNMPLDKMLHDVEIMQYTGLQDNEKVEVYEGDILESIRDKMLSKWVVRFKDGCFGISNIIEGLSYENMPFYCCDNAYYFYDRKVIGNIHEHPHLLTHP